MESTRKKVFVVYGRGSLSHQTIKNRMNYDRFFPVCATAKKFEMLMKSNAWTLSTLQHIEDLDYEVVTLKNWDGLTKEDAQGFIYRNWLIKRVDLDSDDWVVYAPSLDMKDKLATHIYEESAKLDDYVAMDSVKSLKRAVEGIDFYFYHEECHRVFEDHSEAK